MGQPRRSTPSMMGWALARAGKSFGSIHPRHGDSVSSKLLDRGRDESRIFSISITGGPSWNDMMAGGWLDRRLFAVRGPMADSLDARCMHASCYMHARRPSCQQQQRASGPGVVSARTYCAAGGPEWAYACMGENRTETAAARRRSVAGAAASWSVRRSFQALMR